MGSSLASILAEIVVNDIVKNTHEWISRTQKYKPDFWYFYVDDHLTSIPRREIRRIEDRLNSYHPSIKFTTEIENDQFSINFLDTTIIRYRTRLKTDWYHKDCASNRILNFHSTHPPNMKRNVAIAFARRVFRLSNPAFMTRNKQRVTEILVKNGFPKRMSDAIIGMVLSNQVEARTQPVQTPITYCSVAYVPSLTERISKILSVFAPHVRVANRPCNKTTQFFANTKDRLPPLDQNGCVYRINCNSCHKTYIGETIQKVSTRIKQHKYDVNASKRGKTPKAALAQHTMRSGHEFNFDGTSIICKEKNKRKLRTREASEIIINDRLVCNFKTDSEGVSPAYYNLLKLHKRELLHQPRSQMTLFDASTA